MELIFRLWRFSLGLEFLSVRYERREKAWIAVYLAWGSHVIDIDVFQLRGRLAARKWSASVFRWHIRLPWVNLCNDMVLREVRHEGVDDPVGDWSEMVPVVTGTVFGVTVGDIR